MDFIKTFDKNNKMSIIYSMNTNIKEPHGRETYVADFGEGLVMKRPLPEFSRFQRDKWLAKQHRTKDIIDEIRAVKNPVYNIPQMIHIKDDEYQLLEERALGKPLTGDLYNKLTERQRVEIVNSIASFLVDMNELKPIGPETEHKLADELKMTKLKNIVSMKMPKWFDIDEVTYMMNLTEDLDNFCYITKKAWSHGDLNAGNVLYNPDTSKISFIDFAEADYNFIFRDIFSPLTLDLGICRTVYDLYTKLHDKNKYKMPGIRNPELQNIMRYRMIGVLLKRFIKAGDDLRLNSQTDKSQKNNLEKVRYMHEIMNKIQYLEKQLSK